MTAYELWQLEKYGNILPAVCPTPEEEIEISLQELNRLASWIDPETELIEKPQD